MKENKLQLQPTTVALVTKKSRAVVPPQNERKRTKLPGEAIEMTEVPDKQSLRGASQVQASSPKTLSNVSFPCGFTPSQCALLASRQRISNYICFKTNDDDRVEILPTKNNRKKEKPQNFGLKTCNSVQTRDLYTTSRRQSDAKGVNSPRRLTPMQKYETSLEKTGLTGSFKWKSKDEIAKYLAAHAHARLLWLQELEMMNVLSYARGNNLRDDGRTPENFRVPPQKPVYLFDKNLNKPQAK